MNIIDSFLNKITMYRLMLYFLLVLYGTAVILSLFRIFPYSPFDFLFSGLYLIVLCWLCNQAFARVVKAKPNFESQFITALILILIIGPLPLKENLLFLSLAALFAMGSKYLIAINRQHIFNPAAFAVVATALILNQGASWWAGNNLMLPLVLVGGLLVVYKIERFNIVLGFLLSSTLFLLLFKNISIPQIPNYLINPGTLFFTFVMLTEPITSPANKKLRLYYGVITGLLMVIYQTYLGVFYSMELALLSANALGRLVHFSTKYRLVLKEKKEIAKGIWEFIFVPNKPIHFLAGQYLEWTIASRYPDSRGNRRYFSIASSPTEKEVLLTIKVPEKASSFKQSLLALNPGDALFATNLEGEFVLAKKPNDSYVFIAGGIGITPFRSMIRSLVDSKTNVPITLFYVAHDASEFVFDDLFEEAKKACGLQIVHVVSENPPPNWQGEVGRLSDIMIKKYVTDYQKRSFYLSGPQPMVVGYKEMLQQMGVSKKQIKTDYFPGY